MMTSQATTMGNLSTSVPSDDIFDQQWHLDNPDQNLLDLNVLDAWEDYTGQGVRVFVLDDGFDYTNDDLDDNYNTALDLDLEQDDNDARWRFTEDNHGTAVMGIIGAERDGQGTVGVAYDAELVGIRGYSDSASGSTTFDSYVRDLGTGIRHAADNGGDIISMSNGTSSGFNYFDFFIQQASIDAAMADITYAVDNGRDGLGLNLVKAAGNSRFEGWDTNMSEIDADARVISVAAVDQDGTVDDYSSFGAGILISAFGTPGDVVTTDRNGTGGYASGDVTTNFNGTSAATPMVSGVIALMLEANEDLGWRDVQEILAASAMIVGSGPFAPQGFERFEFTSNSGESWNGGGMIHSNDYGFGLVDATAAVRLAEVWFDTGFGTESATSANQGLVSLDLGNGGPIPDNSPAGLTASATSNDAQFRIEYSTVEITMSPSHTYMGDLTIILEGPDGTQSILHDQTGFDAQFPGEWTFTSQAFRGANADGEWTVRIIDNVGADVGTVTGIQVNHWGADNQNDRHVFTDQLSEIRDAVGAGNFAADGRTVIDDTNGGFDTIMTAAVTSGSTIYLDQSRTSTIDGVQLTIHDSYEDVVGGTGDDMIVGNGGGHILIGGRGNDTIDSGSGNSDLSASSLYGDEGNDLYYVRNVSDFVSEELGQGSDTVLAAVDHTLAEGSEIEQLRTTSHSGTSNIDLRGNELFQRIIGNDGDNRLHDGGRGEGGLLIGRGGDDTYLIYNDDTEIREDAGEGTDRVLTNVDYVLAADDSIEIIRTTSSTGTRDIDLRGNRDAQEIVGNAGENRLHDGGRGAGDMLVGGAGDDVFLVYNEDTIVVETGTVANGGDDRVMTNVDYRLDGDVRIEQLQTTNSGGTKDIDLRGNFRQQTIIGNDGDNVLHDGGAGRGDVLIGGGGDDRYVIYNEDTDVREVGNNGYDRILTNVDYRMTGDMRVEQLQTTNSNGTKDIDLTGTTRTQTIIGNNGDNRIDGKKGADILTGRGGEDTFVFSTTLSASNVDEITDFNVADDTIELHQDIFAAIGTGDLAASAFRANTSGQAADANDRIIYDTNNGLLYYDADGNGAGARVLFAELDSGLAITHDDFNVV